MEKAKLKSVGLTERQYRELEGVKAAFEEDFDKRLSFGELISVLCRGYMSARIIIRGQAEIILEGTFETPSSGAEAQVSDNEQ